MTGSESFTLSVLTEPFAVCRLDSQADVPSWAASSSFSSVTRTAEELSVICPAQQVPEGATCERPWRALKVEGPLDFSMVGVLAALAGVLAEAGISILAVGTYDTDYVLVKSDQLEQAVGALRERGYRVVR